MAFSNFSRAINSHSDCFRPDTLMQLTHLPVRDKTYLPRGNGLSYSDCCINDHNVIIDTRRFNHLLSFDEYTGIAVCEGGVRFADLFLLHPEYIPPVIPGTLYATLAGSVANDIHGKNNSLAGSLGEHIVWLDVLVNQTIIRCNRLENSTLFYATIAGLGLTGIIIRIALQLKKASRFVYVDTEKHNDWSQLLHRLQDGATTHDYQVAWLDLLSPYRSLLFLATYCDQTIDAKPYDFRLPNLSIRLVSKSIMHLFNSLYFHRTKTNTQLKSISQFNNPLDSIKNWNGLYGKKGLLQFQGVFGADDAETTLDRLLTIINTCKATATLAVLKYFSKPGSGLLTFVQSGFTLAIDFINDDNARQAIQTMNQLMTDIGGKVYLAKDRLLTPAQFAIQYPNYPHFNSVLAHYQSKGQSNLSRRIGLHS